MNTFELAVRQGALPSTIEELVPLSFMGQAAVKAYTAKIKAMKELGIAEEQRAATLADGQDAGEMLIRIEARIGELARKMPQEHKAGPGQGGKKQIKGKPNAVSNSKEKHEKIGITKSRMHTAETISDHPEAIEEAIAKAREDEDIPTRSDVINIIHSKKKAENKKRDNEDKAKFKDINQQVLKTAEIINNLCNSLTLYTDHWDDISPKAKYKLGESVEMFMNIFKRLNKEKLDKKFLISNN